MIGKFNKLTQTESVPNANKKKLLNRLFPSSVQIFFSWIRKGFLSPENICVIPTTIHTPSLLRTHHFFSIVSGGSNPSYPTPFLKGAHHG